MSLQRVKHPRRFKARPPPPAGCGIRRSPKHPAQSSSRQQAAGRMMSLRASERERLGTVVVEQRILRLSLLFCRRVVYTEGPSQAAFRTLWYTNLKLVMRPGACMFAYTYGRAEPCRRGRGGTLCVKGYVHPVNV